MNIGRKGLGESHLGKYSYMKSGVCHSKWFLSLVLLGIVSGLALMAGCSQLPTHQEYIPPIEADHQNAQTQALFTIQQNNKKGCIDVDGRIVIEPKFDDIYCSTDKLLPFLEDGKWGFVNQAGHVVLKPQFEQLGLTGYANQFQDGLATVRINQKWGYIDSLGKFAIEPKYDYAESFQDGLAIVYLGAMDLLGYRLRSPNGVFIDTSGRNVFPDAKFIAERGFSDGLAIVSYEGKFGYIDKGGNYAIPPQSRFTSPFSEGLAVFSESSYGDFGYVNKLGETVIPPTYKQAGEFSHGLAAVMFDNGKYGYIDTSGKTMIEPQYSVADTFYEGRAVVTVGMKNGYIDRTGKQVTPVQFGSAERFVNGLARVSFDDQNPPYENKDHGYIDKAGKFVWSPSH